MDKMRSMPHTGFPPPRPHLSAVRPYCKRKLMHNPLTPLQKEEVAINNIFKRMLERLWVSRVDGHLLASCLTLQIHDKGLIESLLSVLCFRPSLHDEYLGFVRVDFGQSMPDMSLSSSSAVYREVNRRVALAEKAVRDLRSSYH